TRTDLTWKVGHGGTTMRFDLIDFVVFDLHILKRPGASEDYDAATLDEAVRRHETMGDVALARLGRSVNAGLPGADTASLDELRAQLDRYAEIDADRLRRSFVDFLSEVVPTAERLGMRLCCHPDDPPFPLMGLPRIMSTE